jgi:hypothetical protein
MTGLELVTRALELIGVVGIDGAASDADADLGLRTCNDMLQAWRAQRLVIPFNARTTKTLASGTSSYTIGSAGVIVVARPMAIDAAALMDSENNETPLTVLTEQRYRELRDKAESGTPYAIYFKKSAAALGTIYLFDIPDTSDKTLVLYHKSALSVITLAGTYDLGEEDGYAEALKTNLAIRLAVPFTRPVSEELAAWARDAKAVISRLNIQPGELKGDPMLGRGGGPTQAQFDAGNF